MKKLLFGTRKRVNQGAGYGLEITCNYVFYGRYVIFILWFREKFGGTGVFNVKWEFLLCTVSVEVSNTTHP